MRSVCPRFTANLLKLNILILQRIGDFRVAFRLFFKACLVRSLSYGN